ncbi:MAG: ribosome biogenesis protein [DPANN group archaeon]|nr:ribosome biogenesis protein [DPANN group archaeon]
MAHHILYCVADRSYTLRDTCPDGSAALSRKPPKYSVEDKYASYRRKVKRPVLEARGLLS